MSILLVLCIAINTATAQSIANDSFLHSNHDSSLYSICKINENEFWIGGENGILFQCDSNANLRRTSHYTEIVYQLFLANNSVAPTGTVKIKNKHVKNKWAVYSDSPFAYF